MKSFESLVSKSTDEYCCMRKAPRNLLMALERLLDGDEDRAHKVASDFNIWDNSSPEDTVRALKQLGVPKFLIQLAHYKKTHYAGFSQSSQEHEQGIIILAAALLGLWSADQRQQTEAASSDKPTPSVKRNSKMQTKSDPPTYDRPRPSPQAQPAPAFLALIMQANNPALKQDMVKSGRSLDRDQVVALLKASDQFAYISPDLDTLTGQLTLADGPIDFAKSDPLLLCLQLPADIGKESTLDTRHAIRTHIDTVSTQGKRITMGKIFAMKTLVGVSAAGFKR